MRFRDSLAQLSSDAPTQQVPAVNPARTFSSPSRPVNNLEKQKYFPTPDVSSHHYPNKNQIYPDQPYQRRIIDPSTTAINSRVITSLSPQQKPHTSHAQGSPHSSSCYRTPGVTTCQDQQYSADPYILYFGVSKEEFETDFLAWLKANSSSSKRDPYLHTFSPTASHPKKQHVAPDNTFTKRKQYSTVSHDPCTVEYQKNLERDFLAESGPHFSSHRSFRAVSQPPIYQRQSIGPSASSVNLSGATSSLPRPPGSKSLRQGSKRSFSDSQAAAPQPAQGSTVCNTSSTPTPSTAKQRPHYASNACRSKSREASGVPFWDECEKKFGTDFTAWLKRDPSSSRSFSSPRCSISRT
ncbi:MAG: hypothetical protein M3P08_04195 [Thermoproteota archaeon]|nr:hypothetical protein [Thermoproteota archaeon]